MKLNTIFRTAFALSALIVVSCQKSDPDPKPSTNQVRFSNVKTSDFVAGTQFGLFAGSPIEKNNVKLTVNESGTLVPEETIYWAAGQKSASSFLCYTPFDANYTGSEVTFSVKEDQSVDANATASDLMCSVTSAAPSDAAVNFEFKHKMATAKLYFDNRLDTQIEKVEITDINTSCTFSLTSGDVKNPTDKKNVTCHKGTDCWQAVFVPQTAKLTLSITMSDQKVFVKEASAETNFTSGYEYSTSESPIIIDDESAKEVNFVFSVSDWADGGQLNFNGEEKDYTTIAELNKTAGITSSTFSVTVKDVIVTKVQNKYAYMQDLTGGTLVYMSNHGLQDGDCISGPISGTIILYDGSTPVSDVDKAYSEITSIDYSKATITKVTEDKYPLTVMTIQDYIDNPKPYFNCRLKFQTVTIATGITSSSKTGSITQNSSSLNIFNKSGEATLNSGLTGDITGIVTIQKGSLQMLIFTADQFVEGGGGGEGEDTPFTKLTTMGCYSSTDTETPVADRTYVEGSDQFSCSKGSSERGFKFFNLSTGAYTIIDLNAASLVVGGEVTAKVTLSGSSQESHTVKVAKKTSANAWLEDKTNHVGYVIALQ